MCVFSLGPSNSANKLLDTHIALSERMFVDGFSCAAFLGEGSESRLGAATWVPRWRRSRARTADPLILFSARRGDERKQSEKQRADRQVGLAGW